MPEPVQLLTLFTTFPDRERALAVARDVVERRLAACVQVLGPVTSVYRWEGELHENGEVLCLMKATADGVGRLAGHVRAGHPYDTPELTAVASAFVDDRYLAWVVRETTDPS